MANTSLPMFDIDSKWQEEWKDMPEFVQEKQRPFQQIIIRFASEEDLQEFAKLINQKLTKKTKSIWFPFKSHWGGEGSNKRYINES